MQPDLMAAVCTGIVMADALMMTACPLAVVYVSYHGPGRMTGGGPSSGGEGHFGSSS